ncbi:hypothetical protein BDN67DRAFT_1015986 [Paxillus ammoniavirescens]|nr:hypothetical protein BDN67DRAFT_1015986 [Paxillus ammoniavirescens]
MSIKAQRECEVSKTLGISKSKARAKGKGKACQVEPEWATSGSQVLFLGTVSSAAAEVVGAELLGAEGQSTVTNNTLNMSIKVQVMDLNVEVCSVQESQKKYFEQLEFVTAQMGVLMHKAREAPVEDSE